MPAFPQRFPFESDRDCDGARRVVALDLPDGDLTLISGFLGRGAADRIFDEVVRTTPWRQETIKLYGRESAVPRLTSWHGDPAAAYTYSNIAMQPEPWSPALHESGLGSRRRHRSRSTACCATSTATGGTASPGTATTRPSSVLRR